MAAPNLDVRIEAIRSGVKLYEIAEYMKIQDTALSRLMRYELSTENREKIMAAVKALSKEGITDHGRTKNDKQKDY